jgi:hypothetical protein
MAFNLPKRLYGLGCLVAAALLADGRPAHAILNYYIYENAGNVIIETAGSLTLSSPIDAKKCNVNGLFYSPYFLCTGVDTTMDIYSLSAPASFSGSVYLAPASNVSGISTGLNGGPEKLLGTSKNMLLQRINGHEKAAIRRHCNRTPHDDYSNTSLGSLFNAWCFHDATATWLRR